MELYKRSISAICFSCISILHRIIELTIPDIWSSYDKVKENIEKINDMSSFFGKAVKEVKRYFGKLHGTLLESFRGLFDDLEENLQQHLDTFESSVDASDSAIIESNYLQKIKEEVNEVFADLEEQDKAIHDTIKGVSDISSATPPSFSDVDEWEKKASKKLEELDEDLESFTGEGDETDVKEIMNQIEAAMNNAKTSEGKARFADFKGASNMKELTKLQDYNEAKKETQMERAKEDLEEITSKMNGKDEEEDGIQENEKLKQYINEDVLTSKSALNEEIERVSAYLQKKESKNGGYIENDSFHVKLLSYMHILNNYKKDIHYVNENLPYGDVGEDDTLLARVESFESGFTGANSEEKAYRYKAGSGITIHYHQGGEAMTGRYEFLNKSWPEDKELAFHNKSHTEYFRREAAPKQLEYKGNLEDQETVDTANGQAAVSAIFSMATGTFTGRGSSFAGKRADADDASKRISLSDLKDASEDFDLDIMLNHRHVPGHSMEMDMELYPTEYSAGVIERWEEHEDFPTRELYENEVKDMLEENDWVGLIHTLEENGAELDENDNIYRYIKGYKDY